MSDANRALVEAFYDAVDGELTDKLSGDGMVELGTWRDWTTPYSSFSIAIDELHDLGDALLILVHQHGITRRDEVPIEDASGSVWRFRDGLLCRVEFYLDRDSARAAVGLG